MTDFTLASSTGQRTNLAGHELMEVSVEFDEERFRTFECTECGLRAPEIAPFVDQDCCVPAITEGDDD
jgi:hypothetical protein